MLFLRALGCFALARVLVLGGRCSRYMYTLVGHSAVIVCEGVLLIRRVCAELCAGEKER